MNKKEVNWAHILLVLLVIGIAGMYSKGDISGMQSVDTPLDNAISFLKDFGFFNVVLPFLLVFAIVFGILEKTKLFGTEKYKGADITRKNLNSMVAFAIAFFVVAAGNVVSLINAALPQIALFLVIIVGFLILLGIFLGEDIKLKPSSKTGKFVVIIVLLIFVLILLGVFGWLLPLLDYAYNNLGGNIITSIILFVAVIMTMWFIVGGKSKGGGE